MITQLTDTLFNGAIARSTTPVTLLQFHAEWCGPCKMLTPLLAGIAKAHPDKLTVFGVDVDHNFELAGRFNIKTLPTLLRLEKGEVTGQVSGKLGADEILSFCGIQ